VNRAYSTFEIKSVDQEQRLIEGVASTPELDQHGHIMEQAGAQFALPMPLLWQHKQDKPIGHVLEASVLPTGIRIKARIAKDVLPFIDEAWALIKAGLVRGLSIGWNPLEPPTAEKNGGLRFAKWEWLELSAVTIPANSAASILTVKQFDLAASGLNLPGVTGLPVVRARKDAPAMNTLQEQITNFVNTRAEKVAQRDTIQNKASAEGRTKDTAEKETFDTLMLEIKSIDAELADLRAMEASNVAAATPLTSVTTQTKAAEMRGGVQVSFKANVPKGTAFTRYIQALVVGKNSRSDAIRYAEQQQIWNDQTPEVLLALKAVTNPGTIAEPAWAAPLAVARPMVDEFLDLLRPETLLGKVPGLRNVPFNISIPVQTGGGTYGWVGETAPKPVGQLQFASITLGIAKAAGIIIISEELAKISNPSAEGVVRNDMIRGMAQYLDTAFIDPTKAAVTNVSPASITNAASGFGTAGTSGDNARTDIKKAITLLTAANYPISETVLIMSESNAFALSTALTTNGVRVNEGLTAKGGNILGVPVVTSQAAGGVVALVHAPSILFADDGGVNIDVSREATVELNTVPTSPPTAASVLVSLWQQNLIGLRAERFINWKVARTTAVVYTTATYI